MPLGSAVVVIVSCRGAIVIVTGSLTETAVGCSRSLAAAVNVKVPVRVGVPVICPSGVMCNPGGSVPEVDHRYGAIPPRAARVAENGLLTFPCSVPGATSVTGNAVSVSVNCWLASGGVPSAALTVKVNFPTSPAGIVPLTMPVTGSIVSHDGAPDSENVGAGRPVPVTTKPTVPALDITDCMPAEVICGAVDPSVKSICTKPPPGAAASVMFGPCTLPVISPFPAAPPPPPPPPVPPGLPWPGQKPPPEEPAPPASLPGAGRRPHRSPQRRFRSWESRTAPHRRSRRPGRRTRRLRLRRRRRPGRPPQSRGCWGLRTDSRRAA